MNEELYGESPDELLKEELMRDALEPDAEDEYDEMTENDTEIIENYETNYASMCGVWNDIYAECEEDWDIYNLKQWTESGIRSRGRRPQMTIDITKKFVKSVVAETFRNPPGVKLTARTSESSKKAKYISDAIRYFEDKTGAIYAYSFAKECAAVCGIGWLKVTYRYDEQQAMPAVLDVDRVEDPLSIMIDEESVELDGSDARYAVEIHGKSNGEEKSTYWWKDDEGVVKWAIICGNKVEDKGIFPTTDIPLVPVYGEIYRIKNKLKVYGLVRSLRDTQRSYNYIVSEAIERLALTPKSPWMAVEGSIPNAHMGDYQRSATEPVSILFYNGTDHNGNPVPPPTRSQTTPDTAWVGPIIDVMQRTANEITGIYPDSYGDKRTAESGVAIKSRMEAADRGQLVYDEHLQIAIKQVGLILLDLLEPVVSPAGILPLMHENGLTEIQQIGQPIQAPMLNETGQPMLDQFGRPLLTMLPPELPDLDVTDLEISVSAAPAYAVRKQEGLDRITDLLPQLPPDQQSLLIPQFLRDQDFPGAEEYANILAPEDDEQQSVMQLQQQLQQMQAQQQQMEEEGKRLSEENLMLNIEIRKNTQAMLAKAEMDNMTKRDMNTQDNMTKLQIAQSDATGKQQELELDAIELAQESEKDSAEIALKANKQQQEMLKDISGRTF